MKKRLLSALLALSVLIGAMPVYALEETEPAAAVAAQTATPETAEPAETTPTPATQSVATPTPEAQSEATPTPEAQTDAPETTTPSPVQQEQDTPEQDTAQPRTIYEEKTVSDVGADLPDNDELLALYLQQQMYPDRVPSTMANWGEAQGTLNEQELAIYKALKNLIDEVASGKRTSTEKMELPGELEFTCEQLGVSGFDDPDFSEALNNKIGETINFTKIVNCLVVDCPAELYWYDKTVGFTWGHSDILGGNGTIRVGELNITMAVSQDYSTGKAYEANSQTTGAASTAVANARKIA